MSENYHILTSNSNEPIDVIRLPKVIAQITICGAVTMAVYDYTDWNPPTPEQVKNLKEMLNIDVKLIGEDDDKKE